MTDLQNALWPLLPILLLLCLLPLLVMVLHRITTDPVARAFAPPALWPLMAIYDLIRWTWSSRKIVVTIEYDDPCVIKRIRPDEPLDGAEDPL
jgi:hypothetical protein